MCFAALAVAHERMLWAYPPHNLRVLCTHGPFREGISSGARLWPPAWPTNTADPHYPLTPHPYDANTARVRVNVLARLRWLRDVVWDGYEGSILRCEKYSIQNTSV